MTPIHPVAVVGTVVVLGIAWLDTWLIQRSIRRHRGGPAANDTAQWSAIFGISCAVLGTIGWLVLHGTGLIPRH